MTGKMVSALRVLGFNAVFDTDFGADLTIVEEAHEFLTRLQGTRRPVADDHLLLAGMDQLPGEILSADDPARLDVPVADEHALRAHQDVLCQEDEPRPGERSTWWRSCLASPRSTRPAGRSTAWPMARLTPTPCSPRGN